MIVRRGQRASLHGVVSTPVLGRREFSDGPQEAVDIPVEALAACPDGHQFLRLSSARCSDKYRYQNDQYAGKHCLIDSFVDDTGAADNAPGSLAALALDSRRSM